MHLGAGIASEPEPSRASVASSAEARARSKTIRRLGALVFAVVLLLVLAVVTACHRSKHHEATVEVTRIAAVRQDEAGKPLMLDFEMSYVECPGTQVELVRGDASFAACVAKYKVGEKLQVAIDQRWGDDGFRHWVVRRIGDCDRIPDPHDEASYALVRECDDWAVNGQRVGFQCRYIPEKGLIDRCPWFQRH